MKFREHLYRLGYHQWTKWMEEKTKENLVSTHGRGEEIKRCPSCGAGIWRFKDTKEISFIHLFNDKPVFIIENFKLRKYL